MNAQSGDQYQPTQCPHLGVDTINQRAGEPIEYPSFENRCWSADRPISLLLTDQATLCLCSGYRHCPRFLAARAARQGYEQPTAVPAPEVDSDAISHALNELEADVQAGAAAHTQSRRRWGWIGAGLIFMSSLLCGGLFAAYVGWQMVSDEFAATRPGNVDTLASSLPAAQASNPPQMYLIVTATSEPQPEVIVEDPSQNSLQPAASENGGNTQTYPQAVLPTTAPNSSNPSSSDTAAVPIQPPPSLADIAQESNQSALPEVAGPTPILDFQLEVPTRRPTPYLDIPTSTPSLSDIDATATMQAIVAPTATPLPPLGTPVVIFSAENTAVKKGDCTTISWMVENVRAVYYENLGVDGRGEKEECVKSDNSEYHLMVILANGATQFYTVTVGMLQPTETPTPKPTYAEEPSPTPTWTPNIPTATPTPPTVYGALLEANGSTEKSCDRGATCEVDLYVGNTGSAMDNITVRFVEAASWPRQLCRLDGVCSQDEITVANMGPTNTGVVRLRITVPEGASADPVTYRLQAVSVQSGGTAQSSSLTIRITANKEAAQPSAEQSAQQATAIPEAITGTVTETITEATIEATTAPAESTPQATEHDTN